MQNPEEYFVSPTPWVPNSELPILVYRGAVAHCKTEDEIKTYLESNGGWAKGGAWNSFFRAHYHPNVHECYGIAAGHSELSIGRGPLDDNSKGQLITVNKGDVMVLPAGVSHCSSTASLDYRYVVFFPKDEPKFISLWCDNAEETITSTKQAQKVPIPSTDPIQGAGGYLIQRWSKVNVPNGITV